MFEELSIPEVESLQEADASCFDAFRYSTPSGTLTVIVLLL